MKRNIALLMILFTSVLCFPYSKPKKSVPQEIIRIGGVNVFGNEPFTYLGFSCENGEVYTLKGSDKIMQELSDVQGYRLEVKGYVENPDSPNKQMNKLKNGYLVVTEWKKAKN